MAPSRKSAPGPAVPKRKLDEASGLGKDGPKTIKGAGKGKRVTLRDTDSAAQSGDALIVVGGCAQDTSEDRLTDGAEPSAVDALTETGVKLPLAIGAVLPTMWRDGKYRLAVVIERRQLPSEQQTEETDHEYYMHFEGCNRRMDEWKGLADMNLIEHEADLRKGLKRKLATLEDDEEHHGFSAQALKEHDEYTKVKNVERIELGRYEMDTWYFSPLPDKFKDCKKLYFAEFDLEMFAERSQMLRHVRKRQMQHPPGTEIYRSGSVSMYEIDGRNEKAYCQNLCYLAKLFLDHKTLNYDVDIFLFYVLCECDERGAHIVGYFSKEKVSEDGYNLACILMLPSYQRKGYGKFLISFSYELSKIEGKVGTPERPLSDLGQVSYRGYWTRCLLGVLRVHKGTISIQDLSDMTSIKSDDVIATLLHLNMIHNRKGQHVFVACPKIIDEHMKAAGGPGLAVDPGKIIWTAHAPSLGT